MEKYISNPDLKKKKDQRFFFVILGIAIKFDSNKFYSNNNNSNKNFILIKQNYVVCTSCYSFCGCNHKFEYWTLDCQYSLLVYSPSVAD